MGSDGLLKLNGALEEAAQTLDQYYLTGRYPDGLPAGAPFEAFGASHARAALAHTRKIFAVVKKERLRHR